MKDIIGIEIEKLDFTPVKLGDLLYHEGPLLSHFVDKNEQNRHFLYKWTECDDKFNRWLVFYVNESSLLDFLGKEKSLRELIFNNSFVFFVDIDDDLDAQKIIISSTASIPSSYLPAHDAYFDEEQFENYALRLRKEIILKANKDDDIELILSKLVELKKEQKKTNLKLDLLFPH